MKSVCYLIFTKQRRKHESRTGREKRKKQSPLIKRTLPHVFHSLFCTYKPQLFLCNVPLQGDAQAKEGRDDENLYNPRFLTAIEQETKHS